MMMLYFSCRVRVLSGTAPACVLGLLIIGSVLGCGGSELELAPVKGRVLVDGQPAPGVTVLFRPVSESMNPGVSSRGITNDDGIYELYTAGGEYRPGAVVGSHEVQLSGSEGLEPGDREAAMEKGVPAVRARQESLSIQVPPEGLENADFDLDGQ
ncbi:hypothetical protein [Calycomorphotria hydatis]|uniref:Carboxypeptidase regulatory-like domain-containing protein n=1 Tax=Calycomorphotria hydatis TaxID=2528027 RepID=A0A517TEK9_9PLAN|nr:hypothetical protein [Calycomorphotria hydatis]QDT66808.1 hypothetical protein V22_40790 [Calycomorphotria hydatis]